MARLSFAILLGLAAALRPAAPPPPSEESAIWTAPMLRAALLGRQLAAADVAWINLVQTLGSHVAEQAGFPTVTEQVDLVTALDARFALAYHFGVIIVLTDSKRAERLATILERGRAAFPADPDFPRMLGFLEHFGRLDFPAAARHYRDALALGGPAYLGPLADRLSKAALECRQLRDEFAAAATATGREERELLFAKAAPVLTNCEKTRLDAAVAQVKLSENRIPTLQELIARGHAEPLRPPGQCWNITAEGVVRLEGCR